MDDLEVAARMIAWLAEYFGIDPELLAKTIRTAATKNVTPHQ